MFCTCVKCWGIYSISVAMVDVVLKKKNSIKASNAFTRRLHSHCGEGYSSWVCYSGVWPGDLYCFCCCLHWVDHVQLLFLFFFFKFILAMLALHYRMEIINHLFLWSNNNCARRWSICHFTSYSLWSLWSWSMLPHISPREKNASLYPCLHWTWGKCAWSRPNGRAHLSLMKWRLCFQMWYANKRCPYSKNHNVRGCRLWNKPHETMMK